MWRVDSCRAYPFKHKHINHFPPPQSTSIEPDDDDEEVPIFFIPELQDPSPHPLTHPLETPPPFLFPMAKQTLPSFAFSIPSEEVQTTAKTPRPRPSTPNGLSIQTQFSQPPSSQNLSPLRSPHTPATEPPLSPSAAAPANVTMLLQDVLGIMNAIMGEGRAMEEQNEALQELAELVAIMQEEAEALVDLADLVEEYVEEVACAKEVQELEDWAEDLYRDSLSSGGGKRAARHEREDSGVGMCDEFEGVDVEVARSDGGTSDESGVLGRDVVVATRPPKRGHKRHPPPFRDSALGGGGRFEKPKQPFPRWI